MYFKWEGDMMILLAVVFLVIAIFTIIIVLFKDQTDEKADYAVQSIMSADIPARRIPGKNYNTWLYDARYQKTTPYNTSAQKDQIPELPESRSDYVLYEKHSNVKICKLCDNDTLSKLVVGQHVQLASECMNEKGYFEVNVYTNGTIIGYLPVSEIRETILDNKDIQWDEEAYIDGIDHKGRITLLIGLYKLDNLTKSELKDIG